MEVETSTEVNKNGSELKNEEQINNINTDVEKNDIKNSETSQEDIEKDITNNSNKNEVEQTEEKDVEMHEEDHGNELIVEEDHNATAEQIEEAKKDEPLEPIPEDEDQIEEENPEEEKEEKAMEVEDDEKPKTRPKRGVQKEETEPTSNPRVTRSNRKSQTQFDENETTKNDTKKSASTVKASKKRNTKADEIEPKPRATKRREPSEEPELSQPKAKRRPVAKVVHGKHSYEEFVNTVGYDRVLTCGEGEQLGHPGRTTTKKPRAIDTLPEGTKVLQVIAGGVHTSILTDKNEVFSCGINEGGTCPVKDLKSEETTDELKEIEFSDEIKKEGKIVQLSAGAAFTAALTDHGSVIAWGNLRDENGSYELHALFGNMRKAPTVILHFGDVVIVKIAAGENHLVMLSAQGDIYTFGEGSHGQLGNTRRMSNIRSKYVADNTGKSLKRIVLEKSKTIKFSDVFAGGFWTMARAQDGRIFVCGLNNFGQLGLPIPEEKEGDDQEEKNKRLIVPILTPSPAFDKDMKWTHIGGVKHVIARNEDGEVYGIGLNTDNELGIGTYEGRNDEEHWKYSTLQKITFPDDVKIAGITATLGASIAWSEEGNAYAFGYDSVGQLGLGIQNEDEKCVKVPKQIQSAHLNGYVIKHVSIADNHTLFLAEKSE